MILEVNPALCAMLGFAAQELVGAAQPHPYWPPEEQVWLEDTLRRHLQGTSEPIEATFMRKDGERFPVLLTPRVMRRRDGEPICIFATIKDISARRRAQQALQRSNRELQAVTNCNQTLLRATNEEELLRQICQIVCADAGYRLAWVGYAEHDEARSVRPVAWAGVAEGYLEGASVVWDDSARGRGPTGAALRSGATSCVQDYSTDPRVVPARERRPVRLSLRHRLAAQRRKRRDIRRAQHLLDGSRCLHPR